MELALALMLYLTEEQAFFYAPIIEKESKKGGVDPLLVAAIIKKESSFTRKACLRGAHGLMQIQVRSRSCGRRAKRKVSHLYRPRTNIRYGIRVMNWAKRYCKRKKHKRHHWLQHYNQGIKVVTRGKPGGYSRRVLRIYRKLKQQYVAWNLEGQ